MEEKDMKFKDYFLNKSKRIKAGIAAIIFAVTGTGIGGFIFKQQTKINELEQTISISQDAQTVKRLKENNLEMQNTINTLSTENKALQEQLESIIPSLRNDKDETNDIITVKPGSEEEVLNQLRNLVDLIEEPFVSDNGDTYYKIGKYNKDNVLLYGLFNITKCKGTLCKYEYISDEFESESGTLYSWVDNKNSDDFVAGLLNLETLEEDVPSGTYVQIDEEFQSPYNKQWYRRVYNIDYYTGLYSIKERCYTGLYSIKDRCEVIPTGKYIDFSLDEYGIAQCTDENGNINIIKLEEPEIEETKPIETEPIETEPIETEPIETEPVITQPVVTIPSKENKDVIKIKGGTDKEILEQLINLFDYVGDPYEAPNGDIYRIVGKYKDNKLLFGIFNVTKQKGSQCKYEDIRLDNTVGAKKKAIHYREYNEFTKTWLERNTISSGTTDIKPYYEKSNNGYWYIEVDNVDRDAYDYGKLNIETFNEDVPTGTYECINYDEVQSNNGCWYIEVDNVLGDAYDFGYFNMNTFNEDVPTGTYECINYDEVQLNNGCWYIKVDNVLGDAYDLGYYNMNTLNEDIPTGTYTNINDMGNGIYHCTDQNGNVNVLKLKK